MKIGILLVLSFLFVSACNSPKGEPTETEAVEKNVAAVTIPLKKPGDFAHTVYIWLKDPENQEVRTKFEESVMRFIADLPYAAWAHFGTPIDSGRNDVDVSYTYALLVTFEKESDLDTYANDPVHLALIEEVGDRIEKILIYDSANILE